MISLAKMHMLLEDYGPAPSLLYNVPLFVCSFLLEIHTPANYYFGFSGIFFSM